MCSWWCAGEFPNEDTVIYSVYSAQLNMEGEFKWVPGGVLVTSMMRIT